MQSILNKQKGTCYRPHQLNHEKSSGLQKMSLGLVPPVYLAGSQVPRADGIVRHLEGPEPEVDEARIRHKMTSSFQCRRGNGLLAYESLKHRDRRILRSLWFEDKTRCSVATFYFSRNQIELFQELNKKNARNQVTVGPKK